MSRNHGNERSERTPTWTVGDYLVRRLEQAGVRHIFGVPGDYVMGFLDCVVAGDLELVGTCNELNAGYAADAYGRVNGVGAVVVTYDVGGLSLLNAVAGSHAERVPVIVISGAPATTEMKHPHVLHHTTGDLDVQLNAYRAITENAVRLADPRQAPDQMDETLGICLREQRPVYIELPMDVVRRRCRAPGEYAPQLELVDDPAALKEAVEETAAMLEVAESAVVMAGIEARRLGCHREMQELIEHIGAPFVTTCLSKTALPEDHPLFAGVYVARMGQEGPRATVEDAGVILSLGNLMTDLDLGLYTAQIDTSRLIVANSDRVRVKHHTYDGVSLRGFISALRQRLTAGLFTRQGAGVVPRKSVCAEAAAPDGEWAPVAGRRITLNHFYRRVNTLIGADSVVVADIGAAALGAPDLMMPTGSLYLSQAFYMSVGWSVPATLGAACAAPSARVLTFVGDGALQFTVQELSTIIRHGQASVVFVLNNSGYTVERLIHEGPFNDVQAWDYSQLPRVFGGRQGLVVGTEDELESALEQLGHGRGGLTLIEVRIDTMDIAEGMKGLQAIGGRSTPGERD